MADEETDSADKPHDPTPKKLEDARKKGDVPRSTDLMAAASYGGLVTVVMGIGADGLIRFGTGLQDLLRRSDTLSESLFSGGAPALVTSQIAYAISGLAPVFALPALAVLGVLLAQRLLIFSPDKLVPKLSRISPLSIAGQKFGRSGLFEFAKSTAKLVCFAALLAVVLGGTLERIITLAGLHPGGVMIEIFELVIVFLTLVFLASLTVGLVDYFWQVSEHLRKHRMSRQEIMDEVKASEGDPALRQQRRQKGIEITSRQMLAKVPEADVIVVNPTHYAVALKWDRGSGRAPVCIAKGVDHLALAMRARAAEAGVPIRHDPPTARALHASLEPGDEVRPEHYRAVAAAIRFAERLRRIRR